MHGIAAERSLPPSPKENKEFHGASTASCLLLFDCHQSDGIATTLVLTLPPP
jgi:hypothetical protein